MKSDINELSEFILNLDEMEDEFEVETIARLKSIAKWGVAYVDSFFFEGASFEYAAKRLSVDLINEHPDLEKSTVDDILMYVHFYICR